MKKQKIITTSWDDGHILDLKLARLLKKYNIPATFYINQKNSEFPKKKSLSEGAIKNLSKDFEIGAHTLTHPHLTKVCVQDAEMEIKGSKKYLEKLINKKITAFCYPYGEYDKKTVRFVKKSGFKLARSIKRFETKMSQNEFELPTTVHAYTHKKDLLNIKLLVKYKSIDWEKLAKMQFEEVDKNGGIFHIWGHSWEIEKYNEWEKLERILKLISDKEDFKYLPNSKLIK